MLRRFLVVIIAQAALTLTSSAGTDSLLQGFTSGGATATVVPIHPPNSTSPELEEALAGMDSATAGEIRDAVTNGDVTVGRGNLGSSGFGVHDSDTIGLNEGQAGKLVDGPALKHEWEHVKKAQAAGGAAAGVHHDPTVEGPCGMSTHATMTAKSADELCELATAEADAAKKAQACKDWKKLKEVAAKQVASAWEIEFFGHCPSSTPLPPVMPVCPACP